jgi:exopolysaccharide biosynthesis protein
LSEYKLQLAINANFHYPARDNGPWDYYPHNGDMVNVVGQAISNGSVYSPGESRWPVLCFSTDKRAQILDSGTCPPGTNQAVAGSATLVARGQLVSVDEDSPDNEGLYPRTAVAIDQSGKKLWLVVIDGRQPYYSEGVTLAELSEILMELGVYAGVNLDGGGSTSLVVSDRHEPSLLNSPVRNRIPMRQRPIGNHLGIYAQPKD